MHIDRPLDDMPISASHRDGDRHTQCAGEVQHGPVSLQHALGRQFQPSKTIPLMGIRTRKIDHEIRCE